jgi:hypothetical protein
MFLADLPYRAVENKKAIYDLLIAYDHIPEPAGRWFSFAAFQVIYEHKVKSDPFYMAAYDSFINVYDGKSK